MTEQQVKPTENQNTLSEYEPTKSTKSRVDVLKEQYDMFFLPEEEELLNSGLFSLSFPKPQSRYIYIFELCSPRRTIGHINFPRKSCERIQWRIFRFYKEECEKYVNRKTFYVDTENIHHNALLQFKVEMPEFFEEIVASVNEDYAPFRKASKGSVSSTQAQPSIKEIEPNTKNDKKESMNKTPTSFDSVIDEFFSLADKYDSPNLFPSAPGVYVVTLDRDDEQVFLYVGQSTDVKARWKQHHRSKQIKFIEDVLGDQLSYYALCSSFLLTFDKSALEEMERKMISECCPRLNGTSVDI